MDHTKPHRSRSGHDREKYYDDSDDMTARVRRAREAAQKKIDEFGDVSEYEVTVIHGQRTDIDYSMPPDEEVSAPAEPQMPKPARDAKKESERQIGIDFHSESAGEE